MFWYVIVIHAISKRLLAQVRVENGLVDLDKAKANARAMFAGEYDGQVVVVAEVRS